MPSVDLELGYPKITGQGVGLKICYRWKVDNAASQTQAEAIALANSPSPPVIVRGRLLEVRQVENSCPTKHKKQNNYTVEVCLVTSENADICQASDFRLNFNVSTREETVYFSQRTVCADSEGLIFYPNGTPILVSDPETGNRVLRGCTTKVPVVDKCMNLCYEPGSINNNWWRLVKAAMAGTVNSTPITVPIANADDWVCEPGEALLTEISGTASFSEPFRVNFCWAVLCNTEIRMFIGRPTAIAGCTMPADGSTGEPFCRAEYPDEQWLLMPKRGWDKLAIIKDTFIPCGDVEGGGSGNPATSCVPTGERGFAGPETEFIREAYTYGIFPGQDHTQLFPPGF